jgi:hypothetical protein
MTASEYDRIYTMIIKLPKQIKTFRISYINGDNKEIFEEISKREFIKERENGREYFTFLNFCTTPDTTISRISSLFDKTKKDPVFYHFLKIIIMDAIKEKKIGFFCNSVYSLFQNNTISVIEKNNKSIDFQQNKILITDKKILQQILNVIKEELSNESLKFNTIRKVIVFILSI